MSDQPYRIARFRRALLHFLGGRAVQAAARAALLLVLVRILDIADYGAYMLIIGVAEMLIQVASFGILPVGQRYLPQLLTELSGQRFYRFVLGLNISQFLVLALLTLILWQTWSAVTPYIGFSAEQSEVTRVGVWLFLWVPVFRFTVELLDALLEQGKAQIARALMPVARLVGIGILMLLDIDLDLRNILLLDVAVTAACVLLAWLFLAGSVKALGSPTGNGEIPYGDISRFAWHMATVGLLSATASPGAMRLVLANALGVVESGLFAFLQSLTRLISRYLPGTLLRGLVRPVMVAKAFNADGMSLVQAGTSLLLKTNLLIVAGASVVIAVGGNELIMWISGDKFENAGFTLLLMFFSLGVTSQRTVIEMVMQITGHTSTLRITSFIWPLALFGVWLLAPYGLNVAIVIMTVAAAISNWVAMSVLIRSAKGFTVDWKGLAVTLVAAALGIASGLALETEMVYWVAAATAGLIVYTAILWRGDPYRLPELDVVKRAAGKRAALLMQPFAGP